MSTKLASILGFYFLVFQNYPNIYAKCWIDGSEEWSFITKDELKDYTQKDHADPLLLKSMEDCFNDYDLHLWDVEEGTITRLSPSFKREGLKEKLKEITSSNKSKDLNEVSWFSGIDYGVNKKLIFKFQ